MVVAEPDTSPLRAQCTFSGDVAVTEPEHGLLIKLPALYCVTLGFGSLMNASSQCIIVVAWQC